LFWNWFSKCMSLILLLRIRPCLFIVLSWLDFYGESADFSDAGLLQSFTWSRPFLKSTASLHSDLPPSNLTDRTMSLPFFFFLDNLFTCIYVTHNTQKKRAVMTCYIMNLSMFIWMYAYLPKQQLVSSLSSMCKLYTVVLYISSINLCRVKSCFTHV